MSSAVALDVGGVARPSKMSSVAVAGVIGTIVEWYDFLIYGTAAALVFNSLFFPNVDPMTGTLAALGSLRGGLSSPGRSVAHLFGHFGDRLGRRSMLMITLIVMGAEHVPDRPLADIFPDWALGARAPHPTAVRSGARPRR